MSRILPTSRGPVAPLAPRCAGILLFALSLLPSPAWATHFLVDPSGGGDFTTIQTALDSTLLHYRDSILVEPGTYPETARLSDSTHTEWIVGLGGAAATVLHGFTVSGRPYQSFSGLTFDQHVSFLLKQSGVTASYCVFRGGLTEVTGYGLFANLHDCEFDGPSHFENFVGTLGYPFYRLKFVHAPLIVSTGDGVGETGFLDCTFIGPADTLVEAAGNFTNGVDFRNCTFSNARHGITGNAVDCCGDLQLFVDACRFSDLAVDGIGFGAPHLGLLYMGRSRFDRCGSAVRWSAWEEPAGFEGPSTLTADSVFDCTSDGLAMTGAVFDSLVVERSAGNGLTIHRSLRPLGYDLYEPNRIGALRISNSRFSDNAGSGVVVRDTLVHAIREDGAFGLTVMGLTRDVASGNGGEGFDLEGALSSVRRCVASDNGGDGIRFASVVSGFADQVDSNTVAYNRGAGLRWERGALAGAEPQLARHNLVARNGVGGLLAAPGPGGIAFNDAWKNRHGDFAGVAAPLDSNLSVDPEFCHDALTLELGSPCGPGGIYGRIGAEPEVCIPKGNATPLDPVADAGGARPFSAQPNPARSAVEFSVPAGAADGRIEVFDAQGRRVWTRAVAGGERVVWTGETALGRARPGLYLARFARGGVTQLVRLVWME